MEVTSSPGEINLSGHLPKIVGTGNPGENIFMKLFIFNGSSELLLEELYHPDADLNFEIDLEDIITAALEIALPPSNQVVFVQDKGLRRFIVEIDDDNTGLPAYTLDFKVVKGGTNKDLVDVSDFLFKNFLTWQPQIKRIKGYDLEWLTYYSSVDVKVKVKAFFTSVAPITMDLISLPDGQLSTINVKYSIIDTLFYAPLTSPIAYDIWVEDLVGTKLSYTQRYQLTNEFFEFDNVFIFENTIGGVDSIRFTGETTELNELSFRRAVFDKEIRDYSIRNLTVFKKNTGVFRSMAERQWALEFFKSLQKFLQVGTEAVKIYVQDLKLESTKYDMNSGDFEYAVCLDEQYYSVDRQPGVLTDPHKFPLDPLSGIFTQEFTNQFT